MTYASPQSVIFPPDVAAYPENTLNVMPGDLPILTDLTRKRVAWLLSRLCEIPGHRDYGGFLEPTIGFADSRNTIYDAQHLFAAYIYPEFEEYYARPEMLEKLLMHLDFMRRRQRPDGSVSLWAAGVGSGSEVGFTLPGVCLSYRKIQESNLPGRDTLLAGLGDYIQRGAECVRTYIPHTSNHRWTAFTGPLAAVNSLFPDPRNTAFIEEYLSDGIDIDRDGLFFEERSPNYNIVAQWGLLYLVDYWGRKDFLSLIERSLRLSLLMRQPSGEAETLFSHRQDRGKIGAAWGDYYVFKRLAVEMGDGVFATAADELLAEMMQSGKVDGTLVPLRYLFDDKRLLEENIERKPLPTRFEARLHDSPTWRWRDAGVAATVAADPGGHFFDLIQGTWGGKVRSDAFFSYHVGAAAIDAVKIRWGSGTQGFRPEKIEYGKDGELTLSYADPGWDHVAHYRPKDKWGPVRVETDQNAHVTIRRDEMGRIRMRIRVGGWPEMPVNIEFLLRETGSLCAAGGANTAMTPGGRTIAQAQTYTVTGPDGSQFKIAGLPPSEHEIPIGDSRTIPGIAERRCHRLSLCVFTPVDFEVTLTAGSAGAI